MMKSFKAFIKEEVDLAAYVHSGNLDIDDPSVRDSINTFLTGVTSKCFVTPYIAYERVSKVLANFHVHLPRTTFLENDSGMVVLPVSQFGGKVGMRNDGSVVTKDPQPYHVYFEYRRNEKGLYDVFCEVLDDTELDDIMDDLHGEMNDYDDADDDPGSQVMSASDQRKDRLEEGVLNEIKSNNPKGLAYKVTAANHAAYPDWGPADHSADPKTDFGAAATRSSAVAAAREIRGMRSEGGFDINNPDHVERVAKAIHGSPEDYHKARGWSDSAINNQNQTAAQKERRGKLTGSYDNLSDDEKEKDRVIARTVAGNMNESALRKFLRGLTLGSENSYLGDPGNDPYEYVKLPDEEPKEPVRRKKKISENENDPFRNAKGLSKPSGNPSMHMQDGDKDFTAITGPKANPNFKPNPAYAKPSSTSNLVFKYDPNNPPRLSTTNPVQKGPITRGKNLLTHLEEESKRKRVKELAARQRERYARQKGEEPPIMSGPSGYSIPEKEKTAIRGILKGQKEKRKEAKGAIKAARAVKRAGAIQTTQPEKPTTVAQPASKPFGASVENLVRAYNHYAGLYGQSGDPSHLDAAKKAARGHYATLISTIAHHPGHPDYESAKGAAKSILDSHLDALSSLEAVTPKKVEPPQKKGLLGRVKDMIKEQESKRLEEMIGKGRLSKKKKKELSQRIDKKMDDEQVKSLGHKFGGEPFNMKDYNKDTEKLVHNKKYMRMSTMKSKLDYPEYFKEEDDYINE